MGIAPIQRATSLCFLKVLLFMFGKYLTEFIGTFFLVFTICLAVQLDNASDVAPLAIGTALMVLIYMGGHISGAHYNPAVTLAVFLRGKCSWIDVIPYWIFQLAGGLAATMGAHWLTGGTMLLPAPGEEVDVMKALANEGIFTFLLALTVLNVATSPKTDGNSFYGLAIGFAVLVGAYAGGSISGGAYNPAVGLGPIAANVISGTEADISHFWIYIAGPLAGGALAAVVYHIQHFGHVGFSNSEEEN
ncbi:MAG: aquaporin [Planctomycetota bacterium]